MIVAQGPRRTDESDRRAHGNSPELRGGPHAKLASGSQAPRAHRRRGRPPKDRPFSSARDRPRRAGSSTSHEGTHRPFPVRDAWTKQRPFPGRGLCCPLGSSRYYGRLRRPSGSRSVSRLEAGYRARRSGGASAARRAEEGLPSSRRHPLSVPRPIRREVPGGCKSRLFTPSVAFAVNTAARLLLAPPAGEPVTARQASRDAADRSVAPPDGAFDAGLRRRAFPPDAASLLPGLLAATRTGLSPAGDDELAMDQVMSQHHLHLLGARTIEANT